MHSWYLCDVLLPCRDMHMRGIHKMIWDAMLAIWFWWSSHHILVCDWGSRVLPSLFHWPCNRISILGNGELHQGAPLPWVWAWMFQNWWSFSSCHLPLFILLSAAFANAGIACASWMLDGFLSSEICARWSLIMVSTAMQFSFSSELSMWYANTSGLRISMRKVLMSVSLNSQPLCNPDLGFWGISFQMLSGSMGLVPHPVVPVQELGAPECAMGALQELMSCCSVYSLLIDYCVGFHFQFPLVCVPDAWWVFRHSFSMGKQGQRMSCPTLIWLRLVDLSLLVWLDTPWMPCCDDHNWGRCTDGVVVEFDLLVHGNVCKCFASKWVEEWHLHLASHHCKIPSRFISKSDIIFVFAQCLDWDEKLGHVSPMTIIGTFCA